jgi:hypothetical protein
MSTDKVFSEITREEWGKYEWYNASGGGDVELRLVRGIARDPDEIEAAMRQFDYLSGLSDAERRRLVPQRRR